MLRNLQISVFMASLTYLCSLVFQPGDLETDTKSVHSYDEANLQLQPVTIATTQNEVGIESFDRRPDKDNSGIIIPLAFMQSGI